MSMQAPARGRAWARVLTTCDSANQERTARRGCMENQQRVCADTSHGGAATQARMYIGEPPWRGDIPLQAPPSEPSVPLRLLCACSSCQPFASSVLYDTVTVTLHRAFTCSHRFSVSGRGAETSVRDNEPPPGHARLVHVVACRTGPHRGPDEAACCRGKRGLASSWPPSPWMPPPRSSLLAPPCCPLLPPCPGTPGTCLAPSDARTCTPCKSPPVSLPALPVQTQEL